jgi:hypothetical protein
MKIVRIDHHAIIMPQGRTPMRVVVSGSGRVCIDDVVLWSWRSLDQVVWVRAIATVVVRVWGEHRMVSLPLATQQLVHPPTIDPTLATTTMIPTMAVQLPNVLTPTMGRIDFTLLAPGES